MQESNDGPKGVHHQFLEKLAAKLYLKLKPHVTLYEGLKYLTKCRIDESYRCLIEIDGIKARWLNIIEELTHRKLSVPSNRPLAISGIAKQYARLSGDVYTTGLCATNIGSGHPFTNQQQKIRHDARHLGHAYPLMTKSLGQVI